MSGVVRDRESVCGTPTRKCAEVCITCNRHSTNFVVVSGGGCPITSIGYAKTCDNPALFIIIITPCHSVS